MKDAIKRNLVHWIHDAVNPARTGTKASPDNQLTIPAGQTEVIRLRLTSVAPADLQGALTDFDAVVARRLGEAGEFHGSILPAARMDLDRVNILRQSTSGMLWTKQCYNLIKLVWAGLFICLATVPI